ncbi:hypothetical protein M0R45_034377 [Rubus argutus]|uniref:RNase H type-1 domain-containing protein n=1 Tax=Rubus argutus TaxID=59490 RepID=A0AAW1VUA4_RUBAR
MLAMVFSIRIWTDSWLPSLLMKVLLLLSLVGFLCWSIWKSRCSFVYQGSPLSPGDTLTRALSSMNEYLDIHAPSNQPVVSTSFDVSPVWSPPPAFLIKINCDASWDSASFEAGFGVIARNHLGHCIGGLAKPSSCASALIAECSAVLEGITFAQDLHLRRVLVSTDSQEVISIRWEWSPREANRAAHAAASLASRVVNLNRWASVPPPSLSRVLRNDGLPCPP